MGDEKHKLSFYILKILTHTSNGVDRNYRETQLYRGVFTVMFIFDINYHFILGMKSMEENIEQNSDVERRRRWGRE